MSEYRSLEEMNEGLRGVLEGDRVVDAARLRGGVIDRLAWTAVFGGEKALRDASRAAIQRAARATGAPPSSIQELYRARGRKECGNFTTPAVNIRGFSYDVARALVRQGQPEMKNTAVEVRRSRQAQAFLETW